MFNLILVVDVRMDLALSRKRRRRLHRWR